MLKKIIQSAIAICLLVAFVATPLSFNPASFDLKENAAFAKSDKDKGEHMKKEKKEKKEKDCSRDQNCNDNNDHRKDDGKSKKGDKSEEMKGKGKDK
jgi:hypothetical protein